MKFVDILKDYGIPSAPEGNHHCRPGWIQIDCPFCGKDSQRWHLGFSLEDNYFNCWRCGYHHLLEVFVELTNLSYSKCKNLIKDIQPELFQKPEHTGKLILPQGLKPLSPRHIKYLKSRRLNWKKIVRLWGVKGIGVHPDLSWRLFIPITYQGETVSWTTRVLSDSVKPKYISALANEESIIHKSLLYGEDFARQSIIIVEGSTDAWMIGAGAVATLGTAYTQAQVLKMVEYKTRAVWFDNEYEAQKRAKRLVKDLSAFPGDTFRITLKGSRKDPGEALRKDIMKVRKEILR